MKKRSEDKEHLSKATVIHVSQMQAGDVYIGRTCYGYQDQGWGNPFKLNNCETRSATLDRYRAWLLSQPILLKRLSELKGKRLACWCKKPGQPELPCHGDILAELVNQLP